MAKSKIEAETAEAAAEAPASPRQPWKRVKITEYKVFTSQGRFLHGAVAMLPPGEADRLVKEGKAVLK